MKCFKLFVLICVCMVPNISSASLVINEIAWQGYLGDSNNEWIELFNGGSDTINLDGWLLEASDAVPSINLSGISVGPSEFVLLERTDDSTVPEEIATKFYSGAISNEGESLVLKNSNGSIVDSTDFSSGWGEMQSSSIGTLSRFGNSWREGEATPKSQNISLATEETDEDQEEDIDSDEDSEEDDDTDNSSKSGSSLTQEKLKKKVPKGTIESITHSFVGVPILFESLILDDNNSEIRKGIYAWNMGDGTVLYKTNKEDFSYMYQYPGEYVVTLSFYRYTFGKDLSELDPYIYDEHIITITNYSLTLDEYKSDGTIILKNIGPHTLDMSYWVIQNGDTSFMIPKYTLVRPGKTITFPGRVTGVKGSLFTMQDAQGTFIALREQNKSENFYSQNPENTSQIDSNKDQEEIVDQVDIVTADQKEKIVSLVSYSEQKTMYVGLFVLLAVLISIIVWILFTSRKENEKETIDYEVIEE